MNRCIKLPALSMMTLAVPVCSVADTDSQTELAKQALNPVAALYSLPIQYNWNQKMGPSGDGLQSVTNIQPVLPFSLNLGRRTGIVVADR